MGNDRNTAHSADESSRHLYRLNELDDYKVAENDPDIRGWEVKSKNGSTIGEVKDLVVDKDAMKVRYIDVHLHKGIYDDKKGTDMHLLVPVGMAALHKEDDDVLLDIIDSPEELKQQYPVCPGPIITQAYEHRLKDFYTHSSPGDANADKLNPTPGEEPILAYDRKDDDSFYNQDHFDENRLHRNRNRDSSVSGAD